MENDEVFDPAVELAGLDSATAGYASAAPGEGWYHLALGVGAGIVVAAQGLSSPWSWILPLVFLFTVPLLVSWWRTSHGWWVSGYGPKRTRWVVALMAIAFVGLGFLSDVTESVWVSVFAGAVAAAVITATGFVWMHVWRRGLKMKDAA